MSDSSANESAPEETTPHLTAPAVAGDHVQTAARTDLPRILMFLHIPKTAGTTFSRMARLKLLAARPWDMRHYWLMGGFPKLPDAERIRRIRALPDRRRRKVRLYQGHFGFGLHEQLDQPVAYLTFLRDPVERVISAYYQMQRSPKQRADPVTLDQWLARGSAYTRFFPDNGQVRALAGEAGRPLDVPFGEVTEAHLNLSIERIKHHFRFVGISERFDESLLLYKRISGWRTMFYASANVGRARKRQDELAPATLEAIRKANALDQRLYAFAADRLQQAIAAGGEDFQKALRSHRQWNGLYAKAVGPSMRALVPLGRRLRPSQHR